MAAPLSSYQSDRTLMGAGTATTAEMAATTDQARRQLWRELVAQQRKGQGLPTRVEDPIAIARAVAVLRAGNRSQSGGDGA